MELKQAVDTVSAVVRQHPFCQDLSPAQITVLTSHATVCRLCAGDYLWHQGQAVDDVFLIARGEIVYEAVVPLEGPFWFESIGAGEVIVEGWLCPGHRRAYNAKAITFTSSVRINGGGLRGVLPRTGRQ